MADPDTNSTNGSTDSSNDSLNGSWVKLSPSTSLKNGNGHPFSVHDTQMEDLLAEAVVEENSRTTAGLASTTESYSSPHLSPNEVEKTAETIRESNVLPPELSPTDQSWIEDWSSRVEPHPPMRWKLTYPPRKQPTCGDEIAKRKTNFVQVNLYVFIPTLLLTHLIAFGIGFYLGRKTTTGSTAV